jgi:hypothetical protein
MEISIPWWLAVVYLAVFLAIYVVVLSLLPVLVAIVGSSVARRRSSDLAIGRWPTRRTLWVTLGVVNGIGLFPPFIGLFWYGSPVAALLTVYLFSAIPLMVVLSWPSKREQA